MARALLHGSGMQVRPQRACPCERCIRESVDEETCEAIIEKDWDLTSHERRAD